MNGSMNRQSEPYVNLYRISPSQTEFRVYKICASLLAVHICMKLGRLSSYLGVQGNAFFSCPFEAEQGP